MTTNAIAVTSDRGVYSFVPGANQTYLANALKGEYGEPAQSVNFLGRLTGWGQWEYAVEIEFASAYGPRAETWFIGRDNPDADKWPPIVAQAIAVGDFDARFDAYIRGEKVEML